VTGIGVGRRVGAALARDGEAWAVGADGLSVGGSGAGSR
jgi:hypothetical protein